MANDFEILNEVSLEEARLLMGEKFKMMIQYFVEDAEMYIAEIGDCIERKDVQGAVSPAHTIKSSAKQIGAERISDVARQIEYFSREVSGRGGATSEDISHVDELYQDLRLEMDTAKPLLEEIYK